MLGKAAFHPSSAPRGRAAYFNGKYILEFGNDYPRKKRTGYICGYVQATKTQRGTTGLTGHGPHWVPWYPGVFLAHSPFARC
jgi:hypothetical protein